MTDPALAAFDRLFGPEFGHGKAFDLARLRAALATLGNPQSNLPPIIHVAGTNGKGSTIAFLRAIAEAAGLSAHAFTKPHLVHLRERFLVAGKLATDATLIGAAERVALVAPHLSHFDAQVAAAFLLFSETPADLVLLETGMGGREDSTNVVARPAASVLTPIALDHQDALGATLAEITAHKAGILKQCAPAIIARQRPELMAVIEAEAQRVGAPLFRQGLEWDAFAQSGRLVVQTEQRALDLPLPSLFGAHQIDNAGLAVAAMMLGSFSMEDDAFAQGVTMAIWPGRLQPLTRGPLAELSPGVEIWVDGGHNLHAAQALVRALEEFQRKGPAKTALIIGMRARKNWRDFVTTIAPAAALVIAIPLGPEGASPDDIATAARCAGAHALTASHPPDAIGAALANSAGRILICGSLLLVGEALRATESV